MRTTDPRRFFTQEEQQKISDAIIAAETGTSGEICVRIERNCPGDPVEHSRKLLDSLGLTQTAQRTAVLLYLSLEDRKVAVFGDEAIHQKVGQEGWVHICSKMSAQFHDEKFLDGVQQAIAEIGRVLHQHFPAAVLNPDELPNKPSFGE